MRDREFFSPNAYSGHYPAGSVFDELLFGFIGDCSAGGSLWFKWASTHPDTLIGQDETGRNVEVNIDLQLFSDGRYWTRYSEWLVLEELETGGRNVDLIHRSDREGDWNENGSEIQIEGFGKGKHSKIDWTIGQRIDIIEFKMTDALHDPRALELTHTIYPVFSNIGPRSMSINDFCSR